MLSYKNQKLLKDMQERIERLEQSNKELRQQMEDLKPKRGRPRKEDQAA